MLNLFNQNKILALLYDKGDFDFDHLMSQLYQDVSVHFLCIYLYLLANAY